MHYTKLFSIEWDDSYNDPDFSVPSDLDEWLDRNPEKIERLAKHLESLAKSLRERTAPFACLGHVDTPTTPTGDRP